MTSSHSSYLGWLCLFFFNRALTLTSFFLMFDTKFKGPAEVRGDKIWLMLGVGEESHLFLCLFFYLWVGPCNSVYDSLLKIINANSSTHMHNSRITNQQVQPATHKQLQKSHNLQANKEAHQTTWHTSQYPQVSPWIALYCLVLCVGWQGQKYLYFHKKEDDFRPMKTNWKKQNTNIICG